MSNQRQYSFDEVAQILHAYQSIFPTITAELASYWGLQRERPWSCLTTDFHSATFEKLEVLQERALAIDNLNLGAEA